jgi:serine protease inhibitor
MKNLMRILVLGGLVTLAHGFGETSGKPNEIGVVEDGKAPVNHAAMAAGSFAVDLYGQLAKENPGKNLFFSPYSMSSALAMTAEGARGETAEQMGKVLRFPEAARHLGNDAQLLPWNTALIHAGMAELHERLQTKPVPQGLRDELAAARKALEESRTQEKKPIAAGQDAKRQQGPPLSPATVRRLQAEESERLAEKLNALSSQVDPYEIRVANALFGEKASKFVPAYLDTIQKFYGTGAVVAANFKGNAEGERVKINGWVEKQTNERIKDLLVKGALNSMTRMVLVNAIYFKGDWAVPFEKNATKREDFLTSSTRKVSVPMMRKDKLGGGRYGAFNADGSIFATPQRVGTHSAPDPKTLYPDKSGFLMAELPYKGKELSMVLLVPQDPDGLDAVERSLTSANLLAWLTKLESRDMNVQMPKFKLETDYQNMEKTLQAMGMVRAFSPTDALFEGICANEALYLSTVCHKAFVEVTEKGTEAAAATAIGMKLGSAPPDQPFTPTFRADKPFLFAIRDVKSGMILFLGRIMNPIQ